jgi:hypothetical protein
MQQRTILVPANPEELGETAAAREKIVRMAGSHMYEPHEAHAFRDKIDRGIYHLHGPDRILGPDRIPAGFSDQLAGKAPGSTAYRMVTDIDQVRSERDLLLAQGIRIAEELSLMRLLSIPSGGTRRSPPWSSGSTGPGRATPCAIRTCTGSAATR